MNIRFLLLSMQMFFLVGAFSINAMSDREVDLEIAKKTEYYTRMGAYNSSARIYDIKNFLKSVGTPYAMEKLAEYEPVARATPVIPTPPVQTPSVRIPVTPILPAPEPVVPTSPKSMPVVPTPPAPTPVTPASSVAENVKKLYETISCPGCNLQGADLTKIYLKKANLQGANLQEANLREASIIETNLRGINLRGANLLRANLYKTDLQGADLRGANLLGADLREANLLEANLQGAYLRGADLQGTKRPPSYNETMNMDYKTLQAPAKEFKPLAYIYKFDEKQRGAKKLSTIIIRFDREITSQKYFDDFFNYLNSSLLASPDRLISIIPGDFHEDGELKRQLTIEAFVSRNIFELAIRKANEDANKKNPKL